MSTSNAAFISYRRESGFAWAKLVWDGLHDAGIDAFLDLESLGEAGEFDDKLLHQIAGRPYFVLVLTRGTLDRCNEQGDWLWREIEHAVARERVIVPAFVAGFDVHDLERHLPSADAARTIRGSNGVRVFPEFLQAAITQLVTQRLLPVDLAVRHLDAQDRAYAEAAVARARDAPAVPLPPPVVVPPPPPDDGGSGDVTAPNNRRWWTIAAALAVVAVAVVALVISLAGGGGGDDAGPTTTAPTTPRSVLESGDKLEPGERLQSADGRHVLEMGDDGRLVASTDGEEWFSAPDADRAVAGSAAWMQGDGNLVIYPSATNPAFGSDLYQSQTAGYDGAVLEIAEESGRGLLRIVDEAGGFRRTIASAPDDSPSPRPTDVPAATTAPRTTDTSTTSPDTTTVVPTTTPGP